MAILLDTNAYLRLAKHFQPLLGSAFVIPPEILLVLSEVDREISANQRLVTKFSWATDIEFVTNRMHNLVTLIGKQPTEVFTSKSVVVGISEQQKLSGEYKRRNLTPPSPTDCLVLTYAFVLGITVVTDDGGMGFLANILGITSIGSHDLLKFMLDSNKISIENIQAAARYLNYIDDMPTSWKRDAKKLFKIELP